MLFENLMFGITNHYFFGIHYRGIYFRLYIRKFQINGQINFNFWFFFYRFIPLHLIVFCQIQIILPTIANHKVVWLNRGHSTILRRKYSFFLDCLSPFLKYFIEGLMILIFDFNSDFLLITAQVPLG